jgi:copper resistance protein K
MRKLSIFALSVAMAFSLSAIGATAEVTPIDLKDGGKIVVHTDGKTYHADAKGKRMRMKDGVVMEGKDGQKYLMKNDAIWKQITEKGTLTPNR